ncbi:hypothetical protein A7985_24250 [Pseudoalteromonas luteoviolacea]|uniref:Uncharacterized protein n=1 Tax=Pseudoalteromonas luteoviolacea TaxID=43657 RepID=A0A1C0TJ77_9GAMM|nr:hypothetical protein [Pseudoalteromonas luteoviolacea]OCQ18324.1 hypothetical protein A7985_24250 [Pseudoalteromonas luteoviolacea]
MKINKLFSAVLILSLPVASYATSSVSQLEIQGDTATFTLSSPKKHTPPNCVSASNQDKWAINLNSLQGQAMYSLLVTAISKEMLVEVTTAGRCEALPDVEQVAHIALNVSKVTQVNNIPALYKSDGVTKIGNIIGTPGHNYIYYAPIEGAKGIMKYIYDESNTQIFSLDKDCKSNNYVSAYTYNTSYIKYLDLYIKASDASVPENKLGVHGSAKVYKLKPIYENDTTTNYTCIDTGQTASALANAVKIEPTPHYLCGERGCIIK